LASDEEGTAATAILDDFHEIAPLAGGEARVPNRRVRGDRLDQHPEQSRQQADALGQARTRRVSLRAASSISRTINLLKILHMCRKTARSHLDRDHMLKKADVPKFLSSTTPPVLN
jgi:hypothetical protein